jgi:hypothetical protein
MLRVHVAPEGQGVAEQLKVFASMTPARRLRWLEEMREFTARVAPPEAQRWWRRFREGK